MRLSAAVIAKNEEQKIGDCIDSLSFADEIVLIDSGSTDRTAAIAESKNINVSFNEWPGHIEQKNHAIKQTTGDWILSIDSDERISKKLRNEIKNALISPNADAFSIPRIVYYLNRWIYHCGWYPARKVRLFRRDAGRWGGENPHDRIFVTGKTALLRADIYHLSFDNISSHLNTINNFTDISARERLAMGHAARLLPILLRPPAMFIKMYLLKRGFLDGVAGFIICGLSAFHVFSKYVKIHEAAQNDR